MENTQVGPFLVLERLGSTRRQKVFRARQVELSRDVALKFIAIPPGYDRVRALEKLSAEFDLLRTLRHPNLARVFGAGFFEEKVFIASELVEGESLSRRMSRMGRIAMDLAIDYGRQIASCLEFLHGQNLLHSKLTPEKILIDGSGQVKVTDLRINRNRKQKPQRRDRRDMELAAYLAPEQLQGQANHKSDLYSLGVVLFEMLTGKLPFPPENIAQLSRTKDQQLPPRVSQTVLDCPVWLDRLVQSLLHPNPRKRPHSAAAVRLTLEEIQSVDQSRQAAIEKIAGTFSPLNAGEDKTEALRLLKGEVAENEREPVAWHQRTWVLSLMMAAIVGVSVWALWPDSPEKQLQEAVRLMQSEDPAEWRQARGILEQVSGRAPGTELDLRARKLLAETRRMTLLDQAKNGLNNSMQSDAVKMFVSAWQDERNCLFNEAYRRYDLLATRFREIPEEAHVVEEAEFRREGLLPLRDLPYDDRELLVWIEKSPEWSELDEAGRQRLHSQLEGIVTRLEGSRMFEACIAAAKQKIATSSGDHSAPDSGGN